MKTTLARLHQSGLALTALTDSEYSSAVLTERLERIGLGGLFESVISSIDLGHTRPEAECYHAAIASMRVGVARQTAFVGHDSEELSGAADVGMSTIAFNFDADARADVFIARFEQLSEVVDGPRTTRPPGKETSARETIRLRPPRPGRRRLEPRPAPHCCWRVRGRPGGVAVALVARRGHLAPPRLDRRTGRRLGRSAGQGRDGCCPAATPLGRLSSAYLNALELRYYLVKLLRLVAFFTEVQPLGAGQSVELSAQRHRDRRLRRPVGTIVPPRGHRLPRPLDRRSPAGPRLFPHNGRLRQMASWVAQRLRAPRRERSPASRVVLCGNPHLLDPVCGELLRRRASVWWLFDRFAVKPYLHWRPRGVRQLVCNASLAEENRFYNHLPDQLDCFGVNLAPAVGCWLTERLSSHGPRQTRLVEQIDSHFRAWRPTC